MDAVAVVGGVVLVGVVVLVAVAVAVAVVAVAVAVGPPCFRSMVGAQRRPGPEGSRCWSQAPGAASAAALGLLSRCFARNVTEIQTVVQTFEVFKVHETVDSSV